MNRAIKISQAELLVNSIKHGSEPIFFDTLEGRRRGALTAFAAGDSAGTNSELRYMHY